MSPGGHVYISKFSGRQQLIRSVFRASTFSVLILMEILITFDFNLFLHFGDITFQLLKLPCLAKDH